MNFGRKTTQYCKKFWSRPVLKYPSDRQLYFWHLVYSDRSFELSNPTWRTAHVTAGWLCRDPNVNVICFATFSLRSKSSTLVCIFGDCNMRLLFTSRKKRLPFCFRDTCARISRQMVCSGSNWNSRVAWLNYLFRYGFFNLFSL